MLLTLCRACEAAQKFSYGELFAEAFGDKCGVVVEITVGLTVAGICISYAVLIGTLCVSEHCGKGCTGTFLCEFKQVSHVRIFPGSVKRFLFSRILVTDPYDINIRQSRH